MICPTPTSAPVGFIGQVSGFTNGSGSSYHCDPNWNWSHVSWRVTWQPVPDIDIGWGATWYHINSAFSGSTVTLPQIGARPAGTYTVGDSNQFVTAFRIQRFFLY